MTDRAMELMASLVLESGARWGDVATPWQEADARAVLDIAPETPPNHFLTRPRGASKTDDLGGVAIVAALEQLRPGSKAYAAAADRDQARLIVDSIVGFRDRTPGLGSALTVDSWKVTANRTGTTLEILAADSASAYGLRPAFLVCDELAQWRATQEPQALWRALVSALGKVKGARCVAMTSAGDPVHWSHGVLEHARRSPRWRVSEVGGPVPWTDPEYLDEQRQMLPSWAYERLHLNRWTAADDRLVDLDDLRACMSLPGPLVASPGIKYVISLDAGITNDRSVVTVCHLEGMEPMKGARDALRVEGHEAAFGRRMRDSGVWSEERFQKRMTELAARQQPVQVAPARSVKVVMDRLQVWQGSKQRPVRLEDIENWILQAHHLFNRAPAIFDPWQSIGAAQRLRERGMVIEEFSFSSGAGRLGAMLHTLLRDRAVALPDDEALFDELANVRLKETATGVRLDHDNSRHDDRAVALALAAHYLLSQPIRVAPRRIIADRSRVLKGTR